MNRYIHYHFHIKLFKSLSNMKYDQIHIQRDENCLPKCIALKVYQNIGKFQ